MANVPEENTFAQYNFLWLNVCLSVFNPCRTINFRKRLGKHITFAENPRWRLVEMTWPNNVFPLWKVQGEQEATDEKKRSLCHCDHSGKFEFLVVFWLKLLFPWLLSCGQSREVLLAWCLAFLHITALSIRIFVNPLLPTGYTGAAAESMLGSLLCLPGSGSVLLDPCTGSTISETTSEAWSVEVLPSDSG